MLSSNFSCKSSILTDIFQGYKKLAEAFSFFVIILTIFLSGNAAGAFDLTGTWDWYGVEMSIIQTGQQVNAVINISQPDIGNYAGDQMFCGTLNGQTLTGKIKVHGTSEYRILCPATYFNFTDVTITVSADGNTLQGQLKDIYMNNDCTITPSDNWVNMGILTKKNTSPIYSGSGSASACSGSSNGTTSTYAITFQAGSGGTISGSSSQTVTQGGSVSAVTAVPNSDYQFVNWTGSNGFTSTANPLTVSNVSANMTITANFQQIPQTRSSITPSNPCIEVGDDLMIPIACAEYKDVKYKFYLDYTSDLYWKMNLNTFGNSLADDYCLSVGDDLKFKIFCAEYKENSYTFNMNYSQRLDDPFGFYWKMDLDTFRKIDDIAIIYIDKTSVQPGTVITITGKGFKNFDNPNVFIGNEKAYIIDFNKQQSIVKAMIPMIDPKTYDLQVSLTDTVKTNSMPIVVQKLSLPDTMTPDQVISSKVIGGFKNFISYFNSSVINLSAISNFSDQQKASLQADAKILNRLCDNLFVYWQNKIPQEVKPQIAAILYNSGIGDLLNNLSSSTRLRTKTLALRDGKSDNLMCDKNIPSKTAKYDCCNSTDIHRDIALSVMMRNVIEEDIENINKFSSMIFNATWIDIKNVAIIGNFITALEIPHNYCKRFLDVIPINLKKINLTVKENILNFNDQTDICWKGDYEPLSSSIEIINLKDFSSGACSELIKNIPAHSYLSSNFCDLVSDTIVEIYGKNEELRYTVKNPKKIVDIDINPGYLNSIKRLKIEMIDPTTEDKNKMILSEEWRDPNDVNQTIIKGVRAVGYKTTLKVIRNVNVENHESQKDIKIRVSVSNVSKEEITAETSLTVKNRKPLAYNKSFSFNKKLGESQQLAIINVDILNSPKDQECDRLIDIDFPTKPKYGKLVNTDFFKANGTIEYYYAYQAQNGEKEEFTYRVYDGADWSDPAKITITFSPPCTPGETTADYCPIENGTGGMLFDCDSNGEWKIREPGCIAISCIEGYVPSESRMSCLKQRCISTPKEKGCYMPGNWTNEVKVGVWYYFGDGGLSKIETHQQYYGTLDGWYCEYLYPGSGNKHLAGYYKNGKKEGVWVHYHPMSGTETVCYSDDQIVDPSSSKYSECVSSSKAFPSN